ncbi:MAG: hypothetical protein KTR13_05510 [Saprospiraceae bacterium]|nr:hypothetical protein [Saprospiraceae bacterium]
MKYIFPLIGLSILCFFSCQDDDNIDPCKQEFDLPIIQVVDQTNDSVDYSFLLSYCFNNGCPTFVGFEEETNGNTTTVTAQGQILCTDSICTTAIVCDSVNYVFSPPTTGVYELRFTAENGNFITETITHN